MRKPTCINDAHFGQVFTISDESRCVLPVNEPGNEAPQKRQTNASGKSSSRQKGQFIAVSFALSSCKKQRCVIYDEEGKKFHQNCRGIDSIARDIVFSAKEK